MARELGFPGLAGLLCLVPLCFMMCRCEPLRSSGYGHMADGIGAEQAVHRTACSADFHGSAVVVEELTSVTRRGRLGYALIRSSAWSWANGIKLMWSWHQPEDDPGQRCQPGGLAGLAALVPAAGPFGLALVAAAGPQRDEVAAEGDLESQAGGEGVQAVRGKSIRSR